MLRGDGVNLHAGYPWCGCFIRYSISGMAVKYTAHQRICKEICTIEVLIVVPVVHGSAILILTREWGLVYRVSNHRFMMRTKRRYCCTHTWHATRQSTTPTFVNTNVGHRRNCVLIDEGVNNTTTHCGVLPASVRFHGSRRLSPPRR